MCWLLRISQWYKDPIVADPNEIGYDPSWGEHHGPVNYIPDTWNYGTKGYSDTSIPMPLAKIMYHVTPHPERILQEGFKKIKDPSQQTLGGHGTYISCTNFENAKLYQKAIQEIVAAVNLDHQITEEELRKIGHRWGMVDTNISDFLSAYIWPNKEREHWDNIDLVLEFLSRMRFYGAKKFPVFIPDKEGLKSNLRGKSSKDVAILEVKTHPMDWHTGVNINSNDIDNQMKNRYTYYPREQEWRIWDTKAVTDIKRVA